MGGNMKMKLNIEVEMFDEWEQGTPETQVINDASIHLVNKLEKTMIDDLNTQVLDSAKEQINTIIEGVIAGTIQRTNKWGEAKGEPITLKELIINESKQWFTQTVDRDGKDTEANRYHHDRDTTRAQWIVKKQVQPLVKEIVDVEIKKMRIEYSAILKEEISKRVKSLLEI